MLNRPGQVAAQQTQQSIKTNQPGNFGFQQAFPMLQQLLGSNRQQAPNVQITVPKMGPQKQYNGPQLSTGYRRMLEQRMK